MSTPVRKKRPKKKQNPRKGRALVLAFWGIFIIGLTLWLTAEKNRPAEALANDEVLALGAEVYSANCATCHGTEGEGHGEIEVAPALNATEHAWHHPDG